MSLLGNLTVGIIGNMSGLSNTFKGAQSEVQRFGRDMQNTGRDVSDLGGSLTKLVTVPLATLGGTSLKAAIEFESAFAGVRKTVDATEEEFDEFKQGFRDMAKEIPVAATEIAAVGEAAGQLGIQNDAILGFTRTMVDLGVATNMSSDEAATALSRLANITQMPQSEFDRLGATIVDLGNNLATTESEIVEMGLRIAGAGAQVGLTEAEILSFAGALSSVGIEAEAGGSAFSRVMIEMANSVQTGGEGLENFAKVSGMSSSEFKKAFQEDASGAIISFVEGLGKMSDEGENVFGVLEDLGLSEIRVRDALLRASGAGDLFRESLETGSKAWEENTALTNEAAERYKTTESQMKILWNRIKDIGITIGDALIPALVYMLDVLSPGIDLIASLADWFSNLNPSIQGIIIAIAALAAAVGPFLTILGFMITNIGAIISSVGALGGVMGILTGPIGITVAAIAGLIAVGVLLYKNWDIVKEKMAGIFESFSPLIDTTKGAFQSFIDSLVPIWESLKTLFESLLPILELVGVVVGGVLVTAFGIAISTFNAVIAAIGPVIEAFVNLADFVVNVVNTIIALLTGDFSGALDYWGQATESSIAFFQNLWDGVVNFFSTFVETIIDFFTNLYMTLVGNSIVPDMVNAIIDWFGNMGTWAKEKVSDMILAVINFFSNMKNKAVQKAQEMANSARDKFESMKSAAAERVRSMYTAVRDKFSDIYNAVKDKMQNVKDKVEDLWGKAQAFLESIDLYQVGVDIIQGLISGIGSMATAVWQKAKGIAEGIGRSIKNALQIESPSKLMIQFGKWTGEGLAIGLEGMIALVNSISEDLAYAAVPDIPDVDLPEIDFPDDLRGAGGGGSWFDLDGLVSAIKELATRPVILEIDGKELVRATAEDMSVELNKVVKSGARKGGVIIL